MPVHDWTKVPAGAFHDFHSAWITHLKEDLNGGLLPQGYYALAEQQYGLGIADILTLHAIRNGSRLDQPGQEGVTLAVADAPPRTGRRLQGSANVSYRQLRRSLAVRHVSGHELVALIEIASPGNKDRAQSVQEFVEKAQAALEAGCHLLLIDLFPPGKHDPKGLHGAVWDYYADESPDVPAAKPMTLASYCASKVPEAYVEQIDVGDPLPEMPLFLTSKNYVSVPLDRCYQAAYQGLPAYWRGIVEGA